MTALDVARAIADAWATERPGDNVVMCPQADGGPGFVEVLGALGGSTHHTDVCGPLGETVSAQWLMVDDVAYIESAQACGLHLISTPTPATAWQSKTYGVGELIHDARILGAKTIVVGCGGSATTDGGVGMLAALGGLPAAAAEYEHIDLVAATDVTNPLLGANGAARVFGPQKGADPATVARLERRLTLLTNELENWGYCSSKEGSGAGGGLGAALLAMGAHRCSGAELVARNTGLDESLADADLIITGEGSFDEQSLNGKVVSVVARKASECGVPAIVIAGQVSVAPKHYKQLGVHDAYSVTSHCGSIRSALARGAEALHELTRHIARGYI
ncbi:glycerate kinase [Hoyosella rhizosphaerae]|nr:glycerate kinase [Hoyosella rhizosphaerae]